MFKCDQCQCFFSRKDILAKYLKRHNSIEPFKCTICGNLFTRNDALKRHIKSIHDGNMFEDSDECVQLLNEVKNSELCKNDNNIMFEDSDDDKLCVQLLDEVENSELCKTNAKQKDMLEIAPQHFRGK